MHLKYLKHVKITLFFCAAQARKFHPEGAEMVKKEKMHNVCHQLINLLSLYVVQSSFKRE